MSATRSAHRKTLSASANGAFRLVEDVELDYPSTRMMGGAQGRPAGRVKTASGRWIEASGFSNTMMGCDYRPSRYVTKKSPNAISITDRTHIMKHFRRSSTQGVTHGARFQ